MGFFFSFFSFHPLIVVTGFSLSGVFPFTVLTPLLLVGRNVFFHSPSPSLLRNVFTTSFSCLVDFSFFSPGGFLLSFLSDLHVGDPFFVVRTEDGFFFPDHPPHLTLYLLSLCFRFEFAWFFRVVSFCWSRFEVHKVRLSCWPPPERLPSGLCPLSYRFFLPPFQLVFYPHTFHSFFLFFLFFLEHFWGSLCPPFGFFCHLPYPFLRFRVFLEPPDPNVLLTPHVVWFRPPILPTPTSFLVTSCQSFYFPLPF